MPIYKIQKRIRTLADNAVDIYNATFDIDGIRFTQWDFNLADGWLGDAWLAESEFEADSIQDAYEAFSQKIAKIIPRISLISQTYIRSNPEPFLVTRSDRDFGFLYYVEEESPVGLMFMNEQKKALDRLMAVDIPDEFYFYWNDAVNTTSYTAKILLMAAAIEALIKRGDGTKDYNLRKRILGEDLHEKLFAQTTGLRHRLSHGEYLSDIDSANNYVVQIHNKVIGFFNDEILKEKLLTENVVSPHRNFKNNHSIGKFHLRPVGGAVMDLKEILNSYKTSQESGSGLMLDNYEYVHEGTDDF